MWSVFLFHHIALSRISTLSFSVLIGIRGTLGEINRKLDKLDEIAENTEEIKKNTGLIYQVALTTKAEMTTRGNINQFQQNFRKCDDSDNSSV